eukprot:NODE_125_length_2430_cov_102.784544_g91_i0.p1 GENE.NODE_125_length_2430_cov_102.784544_g91_i0~~NODE_125_length_2430_cov_102.784544_g91_i0.p1  ORF type:complete len:601 (+),score=147.29 NODE_125_length_2430_cov_102.784544_g91_i0:500-2302(+)
MWPTLNNYFIQCSHGQISFPESKGIALTVTIAQSTQDSAGRGETVDRAVAAAAQQGVDLNSYDHRIFVMSVWSNGGVGVGTFYCSPGSSNCHVWVSETFNDNPTYQDMQYAKRHDIWAHELGHNLGWSHAGVEGKSDEYADYSSVMGIGTQGLRCPHVSHMLNAGWNMGVVNVDIPAGQSKDYEVYPLSTQSTGKSHGLQIYDVFVEYRTAADNELAGITREYTTQPATTVNFVDKVEVIQRDGDYTIRLAVLGVGESYDSGIGWSVQFKSTQTTYAAVTVSTIDMCATNPCNGHGTCAAQFDSFVCTCGTGWVGDDCNTPDPCKVTGACVQGTCVVSDALQAVCTCNTGFMGAACDQAWPNHCSPDPCNGHGDCTNEQTTFVCTCAAGWFGATCTEQVQDHCAPNPCNGGSCVNNPDSYTCNCPAGKFGTNCESSVCVANTIEIKGSPFASYFDGVYTKISGADQFGVPVYEKTSAGGVKPMYVFKRWDWFFVGQAYTQNSGFSVSTDPMGSDPVNPVQEWSNYVTKSMFCCGACTAGLQEDLTPLQSQSQANHVLPVAALGLGCVVVVVMVVAIRYRKQEQAAAALALEDDGTALSLI